MNTFGMDVYARYFHAFHTVEELQQGLSELSMSAKLPRMILGGGSNILFTRDYEGLILKNEIRGITILREDDDVVYVEAGAGENWHAFVMHTLKMGWNGLENLALIPGSVGASPLQNIGAYGVEVRDRIHSLKVIDLDDQSLVEFKNNDCVFGYRDSVFKNKYKGKFAILSVTFQLLKKPRLQLDYGAIRQELESMHIQNPAAADVAAAVIRIRTSKLPDPAVVGNAGSFFKNPTVDEHSYLALKKSYPDLIAYGLPSGNYKLAAGWIIEKAGWKGYRDGDAGCHPAQALVLVNYGHATGREILNLCQKIKSDVQKQFGLMLEEEVNII